ncbi:hypothetical protein ACHQM5_000235 [Ranunculus cassubicifolius]
MAAKPLTSEAIALTEKKMDMTLEEIIKMNKKPAAKAAKVTKATNHRTSNKSQKPLNASAAQGNSSKLRRYMDSRSSMRQGALAQRRSSFQGNQFAIANEVARKAASAPNRNGPYNRNRMANWNKPRVGAMPVQRRPVGFPVVKKQNQQQQHARIVPKQRPTLDSLFANMKEQRIRTQQNIAHQNMARRTGPVGGGQMRQRGRGGRFGNDY